MKSMRFDEAQLVASRVKN